MNRKLFEIEQSKNEVVETSVPVSASVPAQTTTNPIEIEESDTHPTKPIVLASVASFKKLIADTQILVMDLNNEGDAEEQKFRFKLEQWKSEARTFKIKNDTLLKNCSWLWGATGVEAIPEIPRALENLQRAEVWLGRSVKCAKAGNLKASTEYIAAARKATKQASNLINGRVKPSSKTALVNLPKRLRKA